MAERFAKKFVRKCKGSSNDAQLLEQLEVMYWSFVGEFQTDDRAYPFRW